jgi:ubiquinone/menaquinone biosynthesis C-methylase UbiE
MGQGVGSDNWSQLLTELLRVLKPNGWIEWVEADIEIHRPGPVTLEFNQRLMSLMTENNQDPHIGRTLKTRLLETNELTNISTTFVSCPGGQWAGKVILYRYSHNKLIDLSL